MGDWLYTLCVTGCTRYGWLGVHAMGDWVYNVHAMGDWVDMFIRCDPMHRVPIEIMRMRQALLVSECYSRRTE